MTSLRFASHRANVARSFIACTIAAGVAMVALDSCSEGARAPSGPVAGPPSTLAIVSGDGQTGTVSAALMQPLIVFVADSAGHAVPDAGITWALAGSGSLDAESSKTDRNGRAQITLNFGSDAGTRDVTATVGVLSPVTFHAIATAPAVADDWAMYAHDARHTSASQAAVRAPLTQLWRYDPQPSAGRSFRNVHLAIATTSAVFLRWSPTSTLGTQYAGAPDIDRISTAGNKVWTFDGTVDTDIGNPLTYFAGHLVYMDDGLGVVDASTGGRTWFSGVDHWGETVTDGTNFYATNAFQVDGPGVYVRSHTAAGTVRWTANSFSHGRGGVWTNSTALAYDAGTLYLAADYGVTAGTTLPFASGVFAFDAATGTQKAYAAAKPTSHISTDGPRLYLVEHGTALVARATSDLHAIWSVPITTSSQQSPVLADRKVIIATANSIEARDAATGAKVWSAPVAGATSQFEGTPLATSTMAAALGSGTLVVTSRTDGIHLLSLADGHELWHVAAVLGNWYRDPIIVNDPATGVRIYLVDARGVIAFSSAP